MSIASPRTWPIGCASEARELATALARCLIVGCGCFGRALARSLVARGHAVLGTTRDPGRAELIEAAGATAVIADPDRVATLGGQLEHVTVLCLLLGCASGDPEQLAALHGPRLEMLMARTLDTTVRGIVYEGAGTVAWYLLARGSDIVTAVCDDSRIPCALLTAERTDPEGWLAGAVEAVDRVLG